MSDHEMVAREVTDRMVVTGHRFTVPLDWRDTRSTERISVFAREVIAAEKAKDSSLPTVCWFQGGPGFEFAYPDSRGGWLEQLLSRYRVILLDQRGTGMSTALDARSLPRADAADLAEYLRNFRADSIVLDADHVRRTLLGADAAWHLFGQSFGGFCALSYLSMLPEHLEGVIITGGFAPVTTGDAEAVYRSLAERVAERNAEYFTRFPEDVVRLRRIVDHLESSDERDGRGRRLTARRFLMLGMYLGHAAGVAELHGVVERASNDLTQLGVIGGEVHGAIAGVMAPATNPVYSVLHEPCYAQGHATRWAAERVIRGDRRFALDASPAPYFTGEMVFSWMFDELDELRPLRGAAEALAAFEEWPVLYDVDRLRANRVAVVGTIYWGDPYVDRTFALETATLVGNCDWWLTNEYEHAAYRTDPKRVAERLFGMLDQRRAAR